MKHGAPDLYTVRQIREWSCDVSTRLVPGRYVPSRPLGFQGWFLRRRLHIAWGVFTGKYDAIVWLDY